MTFISETWLNCSVTNSMLDPLHHFNIFRCDRPNRPGQALHHFNIFRCDRPNRPGGGVCAMIPLQYKCHEHVFSDDDLSMLKISGCEIVCIDVTIVTTKHCFIVVYRPPNSSDPKSESQIKITNLKHLIVKLTHPVYNTIIVGDFNLPRINWATHDYPHDGLHDVMYDCFNSLGFIQFVHDASRVTRSVNNNNVLDLILCNNCIGVDIDMLDPPISNSDHAIIKFSVFSDSVLNNSPSFIDTNIKLACYDWSSADYPAINDALSNIDWNSLFGFNFYAEDLWSEFKKIIWPIITLFVPSKFIPHNSKYRVRHYPKHVRNLLSRKAAIWRHLKTSRTPALFSKYCYITNECKLAIYKFDALREERLLEANNLGAFYKFINNKIGNKSDISPLKNSSNVLITSDLDRANLLNEYFQSVFTSDNGSNPNFTPRIQPTNNGISDIEITPAITCRVLVKLKTNSAAGPDGLPPIFFNYTAQSLSFPLSILFRSLIDLRSVPSEWRHSIITPKFKKGFPTDPSNYRPIALTCTCSKVLESIISSQLSQYLLDHKLITPHQHGFLKRHSTSTNLLESRHDWTISLANRNSVNIAYIDFKSAFDCISHPKLLIKLSSYGIKGNLYHWIAAFLSNRSQSVKINSSLSASALVTSGVPQGSALGPLLFNLFINDITDHLDPSATAKLFADDIKLYTSFSNISPSILQSQLNIIQAWSTLWQLRISYSKCSILSIGPHQQNNIFQIDQHTISKVEHATDLGVTIDSKLKFKIHINGIVTIAHQRKSLILRCFLSRNTLNLIRAFKIYVS